MTDAEKAAADAEAAAKAKADAEAAAKANQKQYSEEELKKVIAERDKAKEKLRAKEEEEKKAKEDAEIANGRAAELLKQRDAELAEAKKIVAAVAEREQKLRESLLNKLTDEMDKKVAANVSDLDTLSAFVESRTKQPPGKTFSDKAESGQPKDFKDKVSAAKTVQDLEAIAKAQGWAIR